jgi:hypothetical protein
MKVNQSIDDLLSSYADGELSARQNTEIQRLVERDQNIKARLQGVQNLKALVNGLPRPKAPEEIADQIRVLLERRTLFGETSNDSKKPIFHLIFRRIRASAAVAGLAAVFFMLVYSIIAPPRSGSSGGVGAEKTTPAQLTRTQVGKTGVITGRLELYCPSLAIVDSAIQRTVEQNAPGGYERQAFSSRRIYQIRCSRAGLRCIVLDLQDLWPRFTDSRLYLHTDRFGRSVEVKSISPEQLISIATQDRSNASLEIAKRMAVRNSIDQMTPTGQVLAALVDGKNTVPMVAKPMLTAAQARPELEKGASGGEAWASLTIVLAGESLPAR